MNPGERAPLKLLIRGQRCGRRARSCSSGGDTAAVTQVDPDDDDIDRWVVHRYAYDPLRHERRHQIVAVFDNENQFLALLAQSREQLQQHRDAGEDIDSQEHYSGVHLEPGYRQRQQNRRLM
jgi:hypothetical protein